jgi:tRNA 2-selenouridine synthase
MDNPSVTDKVDGASLGRFDMLIDARSPGEFAEDHLPGAVNLPVLDDAERALVGTTYVQKSRFLARRMGAALVARNVARHLDTALADKGSDFRPLVYCWRGGQRSGSMALILAQVGWRTTVLQGGYRTYRRDVQKRLYEDQLAQRLVLLEGGTGTAKTAILNRVRDLGGQAIDLEALARHRGSLFGAMQGEAQPSQKWFESCLMEELGRMDASRPVLVEAESNKIGQRSLPPAMWKAMLMAPRIVVSAPIGARSAYLARAYPEVIANRALLEAVLSKLQTYPGRKQLQSWREMADAGEFDALIRQVVERHYDPSYARFARGDQRLKLAEIALPSLDAEAQASAATEIMRLLER